MSINERIREIRKSKGMTQADFARTLNIKQATLSQIENGVIQPSLTLIKEVHRKHQISYKGLIEGGENFPTFKSSVTIDEGIKSQIDEIEEHFKLLETLRDRILDIKTMLHENTELGISDSNSQYREIFRRHANDLWYYRTGSKLYNELDQPVDLKSMTLDELISYNSQLRSSVSFFSNSFFYLFRELYSQFLINSDPAKFDF